MENKQKTKNKITFKEFQMNIWNEEIKMLKHQPLSDEYVNIFKKLDWIKKLDPDTFDFLKIEGTLNGRFFQPSKETKIKNVWISIYNGQLYAHILYWKNRHTKSFKNLPQIDWNS